MEEGIEPTEKKNLEGGSGSTLQTPAETLPSTEFVKVEKNLASLGFFTPSSNRLRNAQEKSFTITTVVDGQRVELKGTIIPSAKYGLPITADQDKWIALCKILTDILRKEGQVTNPVSFTSAEILRLLHKHRHSGKNYQEIEEWLDVLFSTTIFSEGVVYLAREKRRIKDRYRVFDRAVSFGKELDDGTVADKNYVWFSDWQLQNINSNHLLPIDIEAYRELKNHIAKALVPLLQVWLYATRDEGVYEKRYSELCEFLNIRQYRYHSIIVQTLGPSLDELKQFGYLADWRIEKTSDGDNYKIVFHHGEKFHRDRRQRLSRKHISQASSDQTSATIDSSGPSHPATNNRPVTPSRREAVPVGRVFDPALIAEFTRRGINEKKAQELLANLKPGQSQTILAQLEHAEYLVQHSQAPITNPAGYIVRLIEWNTPVPDSFETSAQRKAREERERKEREQRAAEEAQEQLELEYEKYCDREIDGYIEANPVAFEAVKEAKRQEGARFNFYTESTAKLEARYEIRKHLPLPTLEEYVTRKQQGTDFSMKPVAPSLAAEPALPDDLLSAAERREAIINHVDAIPEKAITHVESADPPAEDVPHEPAATLASARDVNAGREPEINVAEPAESEPMIIELASLPPSEESDSRSTEQGIA